MLLDKQVLFSDAQPITASCYSVNYVYLGKGDVSYVPLVIQVSETFAGLDSLSVEVQTAAAQNFSNPKSLATMSLTVDELTEGAQFPITYLPKGNLGYMRIKYVVTGTGTAGKITAAATVANPTDWTDL